MKQLIKNNQLKQKIKLKRKNDYSDIDVEKLKEILNSNKPDKL